MRRILAIAALLGLLTGAVAPGITSGAQTGGSTAASASSVATLSVVDTAVPGGYGSVTRLLLVMLENHSYSSIVNNSSAPYLNSLIKKYGLATNMTGVAHPSEPNYLALFSGSTQGVKDDGVYDFGGANLADQLDARGKTWRAVAENVPLGCYTGAVAAGGPDGTGTYARKHEPAIMFTDISTNSARCANITDLRHFSLTRANFQFIVPNLCHDMHDCSVAVGDAWVKKFLTPVIANPNFAHTLVVITFDEGTDAAGGGGKIPTILVGPMIRTAIRSSIAHNHYSVLRTIENIWSLGCLNKSCAANDLREFFKP
jgi:hypothetical protein